jgi:hypothetical protein
MKTSALLSLLLFSACASKDGFIDQQTFDCSPGQIVTIQAGLDASSTHMEGMDDQHTLIVLVGNNSHEDIVVKFVRADQPTDATSTYRFTNAYRTFNQTIAQGDEAELKIPMSGRAIRPEIEQQVRASRDISIDVTVGLTNGDAYRCRFQIPVR